MAMLEIKDIHKTFYTYDDKPRFHIGPFPRGNARRVRSALHVLNGVDLSVEKGDVVAILGPSGSGKTTLLRCLNFLETADSGTLVFDGESFDLGRISRADIARLRKKTAFVFQNYNLIGHYTVLDNMISALLILGVGEKKAEKKALKYLEKVGLKGFEKSRASKLSSGQKQRLAIARALASNPKILLCDEATSALDPQTTASILELLKSINEQFQITIVIITHQMSVIREICNRVAIIEHGELVENGLVEDIFSHPKSKAARELILRDVPENSGKAEGAVAAQMERIQGDKKLRIVFTENSAFEPVIANMILQFGKPVNILRADTKNVGGVAKGEMILGLPDDRHLQIDMEQYLTEHGLEIEEVTGDVE